MPTSLLSHTHTIGPCREECKPVHPVPQMSMPLLPSSSSPLWNALPCFPEAAAFPLKAVSSGKPLLLPSFKDSVPSLLPEHSVQKAMVASRRCWPLPLSRLQEDSRQHLEQPSGTRHHPDSALGNKTGQESKLTLLTLFRKGPMHSQKGTEKMKTLRLQPLTVSTVCTVCGAPETVHRNTPSDSDPPRFGAPGLTHHLRT